MPIGELATAERQRIESKWRDSASVRRNVMLKWELAKRDPLYFQRWFVYTNKAQGRENLVRAFPWNRPHLKALNEVWKDNQMVAVNKHRQVLATWWGASISLWDAACHDHRLIMLQSKRLDDAVGDRETGDGSLGRVKFIIDHLPARELYLPQLCEGNILTERVEIPDTSSTLWAIPQGPDVIRQRTASGIWSDEASVQEQLGESLTASIPCIRSGGWMVLTFTSSLKDGGTCRRIVKDLPDEM